MSRSAPPILALHDVTVTYLGGAVTAVREVSLEVPRGTTVALLGANGAGKTTTVRAITNLVGYHGGRMTGRIEYDGARVDGLSPSRLPGLGVAHVMENRRVFAALSVADNLLAGGHTLKSRKDRLAALARVLELFPRLAERQGQKAGYLSGGEQQMLAIGRALMQSPRLLLLDEPSLGLAPRIVGQITDVLREINRQGTSILLIEQNTALALDIASYGYVLEQGRVAAEGTAGQLRDDPDLQALYLGGSVAERVGDELAATKAELS
ncbi:ABC transporter ATP-binding protein [Streptomyces sp. Y7]|uniref:ABC transporter ATP-binding protein n=1 Tax=Streptomyces sp. Y7 TaxID=3342392 RepID=UPI00370FD21B